MSDRYYFKVHKHPSEMVIAICDEEVLGNTYRGEKLKISVNEGFYGGNLVDEEFLKTNIGSFTILNIVGNRIVDFALRAGLISEGCIIQIGDVKHAQAVRM